MEEGEGNAEQVGAMGETSNSQEHGVAGEDRRDMVTNRDTARILAEEAEEAEERRDEPGGKLYRKARPAREPAQVYSVRMPVERLEQLRQAAEREGTTPSALMRRWILERLDQETLRSGIRGRQLNVRTEDLEIMVLLLREPSVREPDAWSDEWSKLASVLGLWVQETTGREREATAETA
jgi:hypothetical protein